MRVLIVIVFLSLLASGVQAQDKVTSPKKPTPVVNEKGLPTYVFYYADWCRFCQLMSPNILKAQEKFKDKIFFYFVNVSSEEGRKITLEHTKPDEGIPHSQFYDKGGKMIYDQVGLLDYPTLEADILKYFKIQ